MMPWLASFSFGLLHGFGFAGALRNQGLQQPKAPAQRVENSLLGATKPPMVSSMCAAAGPDVVRDHQRWR